jgi:predicted transcriptional regulator
MPKRGSKAKDAGILVTTVRLPIELHRRLSFAAIDEGVTASDVIQRALAAYLDREGIPARLKRERDQLGPR